VEGYTPEVRGRIVLRVECKELEKGQLDISHLEIAMVVEKGHTLEEGLEQMLAENTPVLEGAVVEQVEELVEDHMSMVAVHVQREVHIVVGVVFAAGEGESGEHRFELLA